MVNAETNIAVREAVEGDVATIAAFNSAMAVETEGKELEPAVVLAGVAAVVRRRELGFYLVAEVDGEVSGQLMITAEWSDWRNRLFWWIQSVYVKPEFRRVGVYSRLYDRVREMALEAGDVRGIRLYVAKENTPAQRVYERLGMGDSGYLMYEVEFG